MQNLINWAFTIPKIDWVHTHISCENTVLDIGSAEGTMWKNTPIKVTRLDKDPQFNPDILGEAENLPFPNNSFDIVCLCEILEHVANPNIVLKEAVRVASLKVIITVPWEQGWSKNLLPFNNKFHMRFYTYETLKEELQNIGLPFQIVPIMVLIEDSRMTWFGAEIYCCGSKKWS